jgi:hypothetical protein
MNESCIRIAALFGLFIALRGEPAIPNQMAYQAHFKGSNTEGNDYFGSSVAISGDTAVVGAYGEASRAVGVNGDQTDNSAVYAGAAYVFVRNGTNWSQQAYLKASNTRAGDRFGSSVAISSNTIVIGAFGHDNAFNSGSAYVFVRNGTNWTQQAYLNASSVTGAVQFGFSVALSDNILVIGAPHEYTEGVIGTTNPPLRNAGAAYVFTRNGTNWVQTAHLKPFGGRGVNDGRFGSAVSISKDRILVGEAGASAAYFFLRNGTDWVEEDSLQFSNETATFGESVVISGDIAAVVAPAANEVRFFVRNGTNWMHDRDRDYFAGVRSVGLSGSTAVIGWPFDNGNAKGVNGENTGIAEGSGAAIVRVRIETNWVFQAYLKSLNTRGPFLIITPFQSYYCCYQLFGKAVAISGNTVIVGTEDSSYTSDVAAGSAYIFSGAGVGTCLGVARDGTLGYLLGFNATPGETYRLQRASGINGLWSTISTQTASAFGRIEYHDIAPLSGQAFYRTVQP